MFMPGLLAGKNILVTGGGTGLGAAMAERFAGLGASLVICGRRAEVLRETAMRIVNSTGATVTPIACDIRDAAQVDAMFDRVWADAPLDALVNNAGATFVAQTRASVATRDGRDPRHVASWSALLHNGCRQTLDR